jgi:hypothetical protein
VLAYIFSFGLFFCISWSVLAYIFSFGILITFFSPLAYRDPLHCNMNRLFVMLLKDSLTEYAYDAELAGLNYNVNVSIYGINVSISKRMS